MKTTSVVGTPMYMPPEMISDRTESPAIDVWSLGITVIEMAEVCVVNGTNNTNANSRNTNLSHIIYSMIFKPMNYL